MLLNADLKSIYIFYCLETRASVHQRSENSKCTPYVQKYKIRWLEEFQKLHSSCCISQLYYRGGAVKRRSQS